VDFSSFTVDRRHEASRTPDTRKTAPPPGGRRVGSAVRGVRRSCRASGAFCIVPAHCGTPDSTHATLAMAWSAVASRCSLRSAIRRSSSPRGPGSSRTPASGGALWWASVAVCPHRIGSSSVSIPGRPNVLKVASLADSGNALSASRSSVLSSSCATTAGCSPRSRTGRSAGECRLRCGRQRSLRGSVAVLILSCQPRGG
jgi:hypothetical protein